MKPTKLSILILLTVVCTGLTFSLAAQSTQTIRGKISDGVSNTPLIGVSVTVVTTDQRSFGAVTDANGQFRIDKVPVGRHTVRITYIGYEEQSIPNTIVTAGKEVILNAALTESVSQLNEIVITGTSREDKTATNNDMAIVSARSFNVDDTKRYAGAIGDPSRMAANFAGVVGGNDSRNDIVVRGNSPTGMLWQLEGLNIPNPNHFGALVSTGGPVSMLNNNNLDKSDFMTGAFTAQYGNATAGVFDLRLRDGNNEKHEFLGQIGFNGFEVGAEGPIGKNGASYIANYRYSTLGVFQSLGIEFGTGSSTPLYQDLNFKVTLPTRNGGKWSIFGLGGVSEIDLLGSEADLDGDADLYGSENTDSYPRYRTGIAGVSYEKSLTERTYIRFTAGASATHEKFTADSLVRNTGNEVSQRYLRAQADMNTQKYSFNVLTRTKINARNSIVSGFYIDAQQFDLFMRNVYANLGRDTVRMNARDNATLYQAYSNWKHRFGTNLSMNLGVHAQYYSLNEQAAVEPRASVQYIINPRHTVSLGYGLHNQAQNITTSVTQTRTPSGEVMLTNKDLDFTTSQHLVLTYDWNVTEHLRVKAEGYYQSLRNVPVERKASSYSAINAGMSFAAEEEDSLVNNGTGHNYGVELTIERFFHRNYYFLFTTSLFDSKYEGSDGIERNTAFNTGYVVNALAGKEWRVGKNKNFFSLNLKLTAIGGKYLIPINFEKSQQMGRTIYRPEAAYSEQQDPYFRTDLRLSYRKEYTRSTLEISLDLQNLTNNKNIFDQSYNPRTNAIVTQYQQSFFPVPFIRYTF
ncbi:TonB-dependent receptor [Dawidia soli]|uniref:Carboxypeptidase-like regulatory domain-containing protein n=1 Tax=Dawidia soli TaxID=2782352 RepID=A0AAP2DIX4_9BACT|nr:TonB-dependent receptor [Dawidia soli]MBT1690252.1 carboxypeptidase-like regulatory domain-containing protein [Dawidia soli]